MKNKRWRHFRDAGFENAYGGIWSVMYLLSIILLSPIAIILWFFSDISLTDSLMVTPILVFMIIFPLVYLRKLNEFTLKMKKLRKEYIKKNPNAGRQQVDNYLNKELKGFL